MNVIGSQDTALKRVTKINSEKGDRMATNPYLGIKQYLLRLNVINNSGRKILDPSQI